ncbi:MAG TPA: HAMP domain-containing sensor histidine kinase [Streptosporangiaceae bacterium]|nr:HAMP domain-containing sensor histidine kinase [Streptosporangiaceae bacterium]
MRTYRADLAWVAFVLLNLLAMQLIPAWQTVPFLIIWISLTAVYGWRLWRLGSALVTVVVVTLATGGLIGWQVLRGKQDGDYLAEVPLLALLFVVMVWHSRRRLAALEEMKRISDRNLQLLDQQRQFLQDASHELGTPIAIALGHAELIERAATAVVTASAASGASATDKAIAADARIAVDELLRMRRLTSRMLLLASTDDAAFLQLAPVDTEEIVLETLRRWSHIPRRWSIEVADDISVLGDADRLTLALDALIENAVDHTEPDDRIELAVRRDGSSVVIAVEDSGTGIPAAEIERIFSRFSRIDAGRNRATGGFGLGLAIVKAIAEAHHGSVQVTSNPGEGSVFELHLPSAPQTSRLTADADQRVIHS